MTEFDPPVRGRPVLKKLDEGHERWQFCGEFEGSEQRAVDAAAAKHGAGIFKVFPSGSWPGGYLRD